MSPDLDPSLIFILNLSCLYPQWLTLEDVPSGRLHLRLERLTPRPTAAELEEVRGSRKMWQGAPSVKVQSASQVPGCQSGPQPAHCVSQVLQVNSLIQTQKSSELAAALLSVYLERAEDLPVRASSSTCPAP